MRKKTILTLLGLSLSLSPVAWGQSTNSASHTRVVATAEPSPGAWVQMLRLEGGAWALEASFREEEFSQIQERLENDPRALESLSNLFSALSGRRLSDNIIADLDEANAQLDPIRLTDVSDPRQVNSKKPCQGLGAPSGSYAIQCEYVAGAAIYKSNIRVTYNGFVLNVKKDKVNFFVDYWVPPYDIWSNKTFESAAWAGEVHLVVLKIPNEANSVPGKSYFHNYFNGWSPEDPNAKGLYRFLLKGGPLVSGAELLDYWY